MRGLLSSAQSAFLRLLPGWAGAVDASPGGSSITYARPDGASVYRRPDGSSLYLRP